MKAFYKIFLANTKDYDRLLTPTLEDSKASILLKSFIDFYSTLNIYAL